MPLSPCLQKIMQGKLNLISAEDADLIRREADAYRKQGYSPDHAERFAVVRAINDNKRAGEDILNQIRQTRPEAHAPASDFWNREVVRKRMEPSRPVIVPAEREIPAPVAAPPEAPRVAAPPEAPAAEAPAPPAEVPAVAAASEPVAEKPATAPRVEFPPHVEDRLAEGEKRAQAGDVEDGLRVAMQATDFMRNESEAPPEHWEGTPQEWAEQRARNQAFNDEIQRRIAAIRALKEEKPVAPPVAVAPAEAPPVAEAPPEVPAAKPLTPEQQALVDSLPEHQKAKGAAAMGEDTSPDPYKAREGDPTPEQNRAKSVSPHENQATADAAKYGLFDDDSTSESVLKRVAADKSQPRWLRVIADLLVKSGAHEGLSFNPTNRPESGWAGFYYGSKSRQEGTAHINLAFKTDSVAKTIIHEVTHHIMLSRLSVDPSRLTPVQLAARQSLEKLFDQLKNHRDLRGEYGVQNGDLHEFISEMFSNDRFRKKLNSIYPEGSRQSVGQVIRRLLAKVGFGDEGIKAGGYLDEAMRHALNVADVRSGIQESAMRDLGATPEEITPQMKETIGAEGQPMYGAKALPDPQTSPRPLSVEPVQDGRDMSAHPMMRGVGYMERFITDFLGPVFGSLTRPREAHILKPGGFLGKARPERAAKYEEAGPLAPSAKWDRYAWKLVQDTRQSGAEAMKRAQYLKGDMDRAAAKAYGGAPNEAQLKSLNTVLGNIDNRITEAQEAQANRIRDPATKEAFLSNARFQNLQAFRIEQSRELAALPTPELRNAAVAMRDAMDELSTSIFFHGRDGGITPGVRAAIQENIGTYMHRAYDIFHDNKAHLKWVKSQDPKAQQIIANAMVVFDRHARAEVAKDYAIAQAAAGTPVNRFQALNHALGANVDLAKQNLLDQYLRVAEEGPGEYSKSLLGGQVPGKVGQALITERGVIPEEIQALWGRREDPGTNFAHTYTSLAAMTAKLQQQKSLLDDGIARGYIWKKDVSPGRDHPAGFLELVPGGKSMGVLDNTWVAPEFHAAMSEMTHPLYNSWFDNALSKFNGYLLSAKTVGSQASAIHNFLGNGAISAANGNIILPMLLTGDVVGHVKGGYEAVTQQLHDSLGLWKDDAQMRAASLRGVELGVTREGLDYNWLNKLWGKPESSEGMEGFLKGIVKPGKQAGFWQASKTWKGKGDLDLLHDYGKWLTQKYGGFTREFYSAMDDVWKSYNWKQEQLKYKWAYKNELANGTMTMPQIEEITARIVRRNTPTYSEAFDVYKRVFGKSTLGKFLGPYTMFYAEMIRNIPAIWRQGVEEVRSPNNRVKAIGASRLVSLAAVLTILPSAISSLFKWKNGYDDKDEAALRSGMPDWQKSNLIAMGERDKDGNPTYTDLGYMNPYGLITNPVYDGIQAARNGNPDDYFPNFAASAGWSFLKPFMKQQFLHQVVNDLRYNQDSSSISGARIWNPQDSFENKSKAVVYRLFKAARPGMMDTLERIGQARMERVSPGGKKYELGTEIPAAVGIRTTKYDLEQGLGQLTSTFGNNLRDADNVFNSKFNNKGTIDPGKIEEAYKQADESRFLLFRKMRADYLGHVHMGLSAAQAVARMKMGYGDIMRKTGMKQSELTDILTNTYHPYTPSDTAIKDAIYAHPERYREYMKAFSSARPRELDY